MENYKNSNTWKKTLGSETEEVNFLRNSYENTREKVVKLAGEIGRNMPNYTVHDIAHIDALWESTDIILPHDYKINPIEGYVLGMAFLIHDLGMGLTAYANGFEEIKETSIWKDVVSAEQKKKEGDRPDVEMIATELTLRKLHAQQASKILTIEWEYDSKKEYLIDEIKLRDAYGEIIGLIAYSHWWSIEKIKEEFLDKRLGALSAFKTEWTVDVLKLACILRIADAIQIDDRRAPIFLMKLRKPTDVSRLHWIFQSKLYQPIIQDERIRYTSKSSFNLTEMDAWWICYDTLKMINEELVEVDTILVETGHEKFTASGVCGIASTKDLAKHIRTDGWTPIDTSIKVGDVGRLVGNLGGRQLYGDNVIVPIREMIQNAADAIRARKLIEEDDEYEGNIIVSLLEDEEKFDIIFEDNGIGMSQNVITGPFLDFGHSFWDTELMFEELPGLSSKGFYSTGHYGIGFYSVFMWSTEVTVITRRFDAAREDTLVLEFKNGTKRRPILRNAFKSEQIKNGGTKVIIKAKREIKEEILKTNHSEETIEDFFAKLCPCLDCNLWINYKSKKLVVRGNDWLTISPMELITRLAGPNNLSNINKKNRELIEKMSNNMEIIKDEEKTYGRAFLYRGENSYFSDAAGCVSLGGFNTGLLYGIAGILIGESTRASREIGIPLMNRDVLGKWVENQVKLINEVNIHPKLQVCLSEIIYALGMEPMELCVAECKDGYIKYQEIVERVKSSEFEEYIILDDYPITSTQRDLPTDFKIEYLENVLWGNHGYISVLQSGDPWPYEDWENRMEHSIDNFLIKAVLEAWNIDESEKQNHIIVSKEGKICSAVIGKIEGKEWKVDYVTKVLRCGIKADDK